MRRGPDGRGSVGLTLLGLALVAAGAYGLARGYGGFCDHQAGDPVLTEATRDLVARNGSWFWPLAAVAALLVAWLGLRWLLAQLAPPGPSRLAVRADGPGRTELLASGAAAALARDVGEYRGVRSASARLAGDDTVPAVEVFVEVHDDADVGAVRRDVEEHALARFREALGLPKLRAQVHVRLAGRLGLPAR